MKRIFILCLCIASPIIVLFGVFTWVLDARAERAESVTPKLTNSSRLNLQQSIGQNIVKNGDFEEPDVAARTYDVYVAPASFGYWTLESGSVDHISEHYWQAADGRQSVDLAGSCGAGTIYQDLVAEVGRTYLIGFALSGNPEGYPLIKEVEIWWGADLVDKLTFDITGRSNWNMGWKYYQYLITNYDVNPRLTFKGLTPGCYGAVIDSVSAQAIDLHIPRLDLPIDYTGEKFSTVALGNTGKNPGRVNSWVDHFSPNYTENMTVTVWSGAIYTDTVIANLNSKNCNTGVNCYNGHNALDFQRKKADEWVYPAATGIVTEVHDTYPTAGSRGKSYGNYVLIDLGGGYASFYAHLKSVNPRITKGSQITDTKAITVGIMGGTGGWPIHLHFSVFYDDNQNGKWEENYKGYSEAVDPYGWFGTQPDPWSIQSVYMWKHSLWDRSVVSTTGAVLTSPSGLGKITIPSDVISSPLTMELWDAQQPASPWSYLHSIRNAVWLRVLEWLPLNQSLTANTTTGFDSPFTVNIRYQLEEVEHLDPSQLAIYRWDDVSRDWQELTSTIDTNLREVTAESTEIGYFDLQAPLLCPTDTVEIDDNYDLASGIQTDGSANNRLFDISDDEDWSWISAITGGKYEISTTNLAPGVDTLLQIYDLDGVTLLAEDDNSGGDLNSEINWFAPETGTYFIRVLQSAGSAYGCEASYELRVSKSLNMYLPLTVK